jgi:hypothetical protein
VARVLIGRGGEEPRAAYGGVRETDRVRPTGFAVGPRKLLAYFARRPGTDFLLKSSPARPNVCCVQCLLEEGTRKEASWE